MSWFQTSANETEAAREHVCMFLAVEFDFVSAVYRFWSGLGSLSINGQTFIGTGDLGKISVSPDNSRLIAEPKTYQLAGVDLTIISETDLENCYGRGVTEYFGFLKQDGSLFATPETNWEGRMDKARRVDGLSPLVEINAEHRLVLLDKADGWRYTHEHHQQFFPGDNGFREMPSVATAEILWGGYRVLTGSPGNGGGKRGREFRR